MMQRCVWRERASEIPLLILSQVIFLFLHIVDGDGSSGCGDMWKSEWFLHPERLTSHEEQAIQRAMADEDEATETTMETTETANTTETTETANSTETIQTTNPTESAGKMMLQYK